MCQKSHTERVVVALLLGALIIIFLTLVLSLVYLRESSQHHQYSQTLHYRPGDTEQRLLQWGAANNVKIKPGSRSVARGVQELQGTCQLPQCWSLGRRVMLMADQTSDPCHSQTDLSDLVLGLGDTSSQFSKLRRFYQSCVDTNSIRKLNYQPAVDFISQHFGPHLSPELGDAGDLTDVIYDILQLSGSSLFDVGVDVDPADNNIILGVIRLPGGSPFQPRLRQETRIGKRLEPVRKRWRRWTATLTNSSVVTSSSEVYREIKTAAQGQKIGKVFSLVENYKILANYSQPFKQSTTDEIVGFVAALTKMIPDRRSEQQEVQLNKIYNKYNTAELQSSFRYVNWARLMRLVFGEEVGNSQLFLVHFPSFLRQLDRLVSLFGVRVARLSLIVLFAQDVLEELVTVDTNMDQRWRHCIGLTQTLFPEASSHLFLNSFTAYDRNKMVQKASDLFSELRKRSIRTVERTAWLSRQTKSKLMQKLATTKVLVEPPLFYLNVTWVTSRLESVNISEQEFFRNVISLGRIRRQWMFSSKQSGVDEDQFAWTLAASPLDVNAFRIRQFNSILLPWGLLASTLAGQLGVPTYIQEGELGFVISHEILHSLDTGGRGFDLQGKLSSVWDQASSTRYDKKSECLKKSYTTSHTRLAKYHGQTVQLRVDGDFTFDENLCDIQALDIISRRELANIAREDKIPGVNFTKEQTFFLNIAQSYCGTSGTLSQIVFSQLSQHTTARERIDGMMMNSPKFSQVFKCRSGSRMNPARRCSQMFGGN